MLEELASIVRSRREAMMQLALQGRRSSGDERMNERDIAQFVDSFVRMILEAIEGDSQIREVILTTAVPGLLAAGEDPDHLLFSTVFWMLRVVEDVGRHVPDSIHDQAVGWLAEFLSGYVRDVNRVARQVTSAGGAQ